MSLKTKVQHLKNLVKLLSTILSLWQCLFCHQDGSSKRLGRRKEANV